MQVTLIGAQGFVGSAFHRLLTNRQEIKLTSVTLDNYEQNRGIQSDVVIDASGNSKKFLADEDPIKDFELSVTHRLHTLIDFPAKFHLHISSVDVYHDLSDRQSTIEDTQISRTHQSRYGFHKLLAEALVKKYATNWLIVRLAGMVGPGLIKNPVYDILQNRPIRIHPDSLYQFMHTDQVAQICWSLFESKIQKTEINICSNGLISPRKIAEILNRPLNLTLVSSDSKPRIVDISTTKLKMFVKIPHTNEVINEFLSSQT